MKEKLLALLVAKFKGVSEATLERIATKKAGSVTDETQIQSVIDGIDLAQVVQSEVDSKITDSNKKAVQNYEATHKLKDGKLITESAAATAPTASAVDPNEPPWFTAFKKEQAEATAALRQKVEGYEKKETQSSLLAKAKAQLLKKNVPELFFAKRGMILESEDQIEALVTEIESDYTAYKQFEVNRGVMIDIPPNSQGVGKEGETLGKTMAEKRNTNASDGVKGKVI